MHSAQELDQEPDGALAWLHIGEAGAENYRDLGRIVALANALPPGSLEVAVLPGDNADDGTAVQFQFVRDAVAPLRLPLHILPGDLREGAERLGALLAWPERGILDTQPGPNRNGKKW